VHQVLRQPPAPPCRQAPLESVDGALLRGGVPPKGRKRTPLGLAQQPIPAAQPSRAAADTGVHRRWPAALLLEGADEVLKSPGASQGGNHVGGRSAALPEEHPRIFAHQALIVAHQRRRESRPRQQRWRRGGDASQKRPPVGVVIFCHGEQRGGARAERGLLSPLSLPTLPHSCHLPPRQPALMLPATKPFLNLWVAPFFFLR
jgi:hypothetical protein